MLDGGPRLRPQLFVGGTQRVAEIHEVSGGSEHLFAAPHLLLQGQDVLDVVLVAREGVEVHAARGLARGTFHTLSFLDDVGVHTVDGGWEALLRGLLCALPLNHWLHRAGWKTNQI